MMRVAMSMLVSGSWFVVGAGRPCPSPSKVRASRQGRLARATVGRRGPAARRAGGPACRVLRQRRATGVAERRETETIHGPSTTGAEPGARPFHRAGRLAQRAGGRAHPAFLAPLRRTGHRHARRAPGRPPDRRRAARRAAAQRGLAAGGRTRP
ncbi:sigma-54 interaction domain protein, partial [Bordetella hinzii L60]